MGAAAVKIKIMPDSPDTDLSQIESSAKETIENAGGKNLKIEREPIAFGLNAIIITFAWTEDSDRDALEAELSKLEHINTAEVIDFRRAFG